MAADSSVCSPGFWHLTGKGEPFRLLFPLGMVLGALGIIVWPFYLFGWVEGYPALSHQRVMIEGFLGAFVIGFLGTAMPRMLDAPRLSLRVTLGFAAMLSLLTGLHLGGWPVAGDGAFLLMLLALVVIMGQRFRLRRDLPPPGFLLVGLGILSALVGVAIPLLPVHLPDFAHALSPLLLYQGFVLLPIMGIGAFLMPRFFGLPNKSDFPDSPALPPGWLAKAAFAFGCGTAVLISFALEAGGAVRSGAALRAAALLLYFWREVPVHQAKWNGGTLALTLRLALVAIPAGYLLIALWPEWRMAWLHLLFIGGFNLLTWTVASRVILGHSGQSERFRARLRPVSIMAVLLLLAWISRLGAEWVPQARLSHLAYASLFWLIAAVVWGVALLPSVRRPDLE